MEEISEPKKNLPRSIIFGVIIVVVIYVFVNCAYFSGMLKVILLVF